jgi:hypothetical protein
MQGQETTPLKPTRASFIRGLPESMPVAEVIERGREAGLDINPTDVHSARYYMRQAASPQPAAPRSTFAPASDQGNPVTTSTSSTTSTASTKRDPARDPSKETADAPRPSGAVYMPPRIQGNATTRPRTVVQAPVAKTRAKTATQAATDSLEEQLRMIVMRIGTDRAREVIEEVEELAMRE